MTIPEPQPRPPNRICLYCLENIVDSLDAHMEDCPANPGHHHILWEFDHGTGLRQEARNG